MVITTLILLIKLLVKLLVVTFVVSRLIHSVFSYVPTNKLTVIVKILTSCLTCVSFWTALVISGSLFYASIIWIIIHFYELKLRNKMEALNV